MDFKNLKKPKSIETIQTSERFGKFVAEPFQKGFGTTLGNALRRVLLSSIEGSAVVGVKIEGVTNEFDTIAGIKEDVVNIVLNIKMLDVALNSGDKKQARVYIKKKGCGAVTAADIKGDADVVALNPKQHILTVTSDDTEVFLELYIERGLGYVPSEEREKKFDDLFVIPVDAIFTPIKAVKYTVDNARVGQSTDYDNLNLVVTTDGSITPEDAIAFSAKILKDFLALFINFDEPEETPLVEEPKNNDYIVDMLSKSIEELELSVRAYNCLRNANIKTLSELCAKTDQAMLRTKNFGRKSLDEIKKVLAELGLGLGMDLEKIGYKAPETSEN